MIFSIRSTRGYDFEENHPPCQNCKRYKYTRTVRNKIFDSTTGLPIIQEREIENECWVIEINSIEDLMTLQNEVNEELIIGSNGLYDGLPYIEIYNGSREQ